MRPRVVVIGAGFGGLAAAVRLQARGYQVTLIERRDAPGGRAYVYRDGGHVFDAGPTVITAPWLIEELFALAGRRAEDYLRFVELDPYYQIRFHDGRVFNYRGDEGRMLAEVERFSPRDVDGYRRFLRVSEQIFRKGFEELGDVPFSYLGDMVRVAPALIRLRAYRSVYGMAKEHFQDEALRQVMSFHPLLIGGHPFAASSIYSMIHFLELKWGVHFPLGGTGAIVAALAKLLGELGGELRLGETVEEVVVEKGRAVGVRLAGGGVVRARYVVANTDAAFLYQHLLGQRERRRWSPDRLEHSRYSMSLFVAYFGVDRRYEDVAHHSILLGPRYRGLLDDIFRRRVLAEDFSLYLHRPTATDPSLAPPGCDTFYVLSPVPNLEEDGGRIDWETEGERYRERLFAHLEATLMPGLRSHLRVVRHITPLTFRDELLSLHGAAFSFEPLLWQSAYFRPHNRSEEVKNLFLVGAGTHPGAGLPGVLCSARVVDRLIPRLHGGEDDDGGRNPIAGSHSHQVDMI